MGTQEDRETGEWKDPVKRKAVGDRQIRLSTRGRDVERTKVAKHVELVSRKAAIVFDVPVP